MHSSVVLVELHAIKSISDSSNNQQPILLFQGGAIPCFDSQADAAGWTLQEHLLLLEGLELHGDDWAAVSEHVGSKSQVRRCDNRYY